MYTFQGEFVRKAEIIFSANYFGMNEDAGNLDGERILDRVAVIPFQEWEDMPANEFAEKQQRFKKVVDDPQMPTELLIHEIGDFIRSEEFQEKRFEFGNLLNEMTDESIKMRTLLNYACFIAINWKLGNIFETVWEEMGHSWQGYVDWLRNIFAPFLKKQHQEKDHSKHSIRRYIMDFISFMIDWNLVERRKIVKICETSKMKNGMIAWHFILAHASLTSNKWEEV